MCFFKHQVVLLSGCLVPGYLSTGNLSSSLQFGGGQMKTVPGVWGVGDATQGQGAGVRRIK
jgi:hypothetical protein